VGEGVFQTGIIQIPIKIITKPEFHKIMTDTGSSRVIARVSIRKIAQVTADPIPKIEALPSPAPLGCRTIKTPRKPITTAVHRLHPTVSCKNNAESIVMINGEEKVIVVVLAREVKAMAETKKAISASEKIARTKCGPIR
jgi:hypothetical protein